MRLLPLSHLCWIALLFASKICFGLLLTPPLSKRCTLKRDQHVLQVVSDPVEVDHAATQEQVGATKKQQLSTVPSIDINAELEEEEIEQLIEAESELIADSLLEDHDDEVILKGRAKMAKKAKAELKGIVKKTLGLLQSGEAEDEDVTVQVFSDGHIEEEEEPYGEVLEAGWRKRATSSALRRNAEVWRISLKGVIKILKFSKLKKQGASEEEVEQAKTEAATYIRDSCLKLGPTFVKLAQVASTRTEDLPPEFITVLKSLQCDVPGFKTSRAKEIISKELGKPCDEVFQDFSEKPLAAASLGQVHTAYYKGRKVAIKVQRSGLKELFDIDLKNLKLLAVALNKFDPKMDGTDRDYVSIFEESARLLYEEIDYTLEANNAVRFRKDFIDIPWVRIPEVFVEVTTPRVLTMEYMESFKLTKIEKIEELGLDRKLLANRIANAFLRQMIETGYFHADPHPGNMCGDVDGNIVFYDMGMMDELQPHVREGGRKFCTALFAGGPMIDDLELAKNAKLLVEGIEEAGILARGADRLAVDKLARYFMRAFKDMQLGKNTANLRQTVGLDLQVLTDNGVFRFPSTLTFASRAFASVDGIGKGLDADFDVFKLAQPFVERFIEEGKEPQSPIEKALSTASKATGLNVEDMTTTLSTPRKIAYIEETIRSMEDGSLKIRVRSLENEKALERMALTQGRDRNILISSALLNVASLATGPVFRIGSILVAAGFAIQAGRANSKVTKFDDRQADFDVKFDD